MKKTEFAIVGDNEQYSMCLICVLSSQKEAEKNLKRMLESPTNRDKLLIRGFSNLRIVTIPKSDCWWRYVYGIKKIGGYNGN